MPNCIKASLQTYPARPVSYTHLAILHLYDKASALSAAGVPVSDMTAAGLFDKLVKAKYEIPNDKPELFGGYEKEMDGICEKLLAARAGAPAPAGKE